MLHIKGHVEIKASNLHRVSASVKAQARLGPPSGRRLSRGADAGERTPSPTAPCPPPAAAHPTTRWGRIGPQAAH